mgnify:FL=1|jgi:hypothetical protein|nr:MAG TPA: DNA-directed RNA polymerase II subunit [Caudoviricetes sp.]
MAEYIDKNATVGILEAMSRNADCECIKKRLEKAAKRVNTMPAADVAPVVHGRWMYEKTEGGFHIWRCSRCGRGMNDNPEGIDLYCYHCGAKMDGVE